MFCIDARKEGKSVKIDPAHAIYAELPALQPKPGMQLYSGKRLSNGTIDWVNPVPLEHDLLAVNINSLDFYPPHYLDSLAGWGYNALDKSFTDSLYYSAVNWFTQARPESLQPGTTATDSTTYDVTYNCFINPAKIKTIWNDRFNNTLLATREFEQRLVWIHRSFNNAVLDLYINNLDKNLSDIDSMAAQMLTGELHNQFLFFASLHQGKVKIGIKQLERLRLYYDQKTRAYTEAVAKAQQAYWQQQQALDAVALQQRSGHSLQDRDRLAKNFEEELSFNVKEAYRQLGYDTTNPLRLPPANKYSFTVTVTGWCNIDRVVMAATVGRTTLNYTDNQTGKQAVIPYEAVSFKANNSKYYDRLYVYLLPDKLSSFMRLDSAGGIYSERINKLMKYKMVCIGWKDERVFFYTRQDVQAKEYPSINLTPTNKEQLETELGRFDNRAEPAGIAAEVQYYLFEIKDQKRQRTKEAVEQLKHQLFFFLSRCCDEECQPV